ncbi:MAG: histidine--tRNA ligase [Xanthomonadales bacterium]|nr:histidine--tRNA ligase [Xanthomonadales bacterium]
MVDKIKTIKGMHDVLPNDIGIWQRLENTAYRIFSGYGYTEIRTPVLEKTALFVNSIGESTDIVEKEMYAFADRGGEHIALRPEGTAGVVRAAIENGLLYGQPQRLWYRGAMFRRERPQRGRTRQFHQIGIEAFGMAGPDIDAEIILMGQSLWQALGLKDLRLEINSLGSSEERANYREKLVDYLQSRFDLLDEDSQRRLTRNPLRILDSKNPKTQELLKDAPKLKDCFGPGSLLYMDTLLQTLDSLGVSYTLNPYLVRGLDYYSQTVFEWITDELGAQGTVCAGGRYDGLVEQRGGKPWPGIGFAMGEERLVELLKLQDQKPASSADIYIVLQGQGSELAGLKLAEQVRSQFPELRLQSNMGAGSFKSQFKRADRSGADFALVMAETEMQTSTITIKPLRGQGEQLNMPVAELTDWLQLHYS